MQHYNEILPLKKQRIKKIKDWGILFFYTLFLYISLPFMPGLWGRFTQKVGNFADYFAAFILGLIGLFIIFYLISRQKDIHNFVWLAILAFAYAVALRSLKLPVERVHFVEYGLLSVFVFRALRHDIKNKSVYFCSGVIVFCLGFLDEGIQYLLPNRVYNTRDVVVNGVAGILALFLIRLCLRPQ